MRVMKLFFYCFFYVLLLGCAANSVVQKASVLSSSHGYVFVEFPRSPQVLEIRSMDSGKTYRLQPDDINYTSGLWVPPGSYTLERTYKRGLTGSIISNLKGYPTFYVEKGRITNLGSLVDFKMGEGKVVWMQRPSLESDGKFINWIVKNNEYLANPEAIIWHVEKVPEFTDSKVSGNGLIIDALINMESDNAVNKFKTELALIENPNELYSRLLKILPPSPHSTYVFAEPSVNDSNGNLYFPAELGQIKKRSTAGVWTTIDTGFTYAVKAVELFKDDIYAGLSSGHLIVSKDGGLTWTNDFLFKNKSIMDVYVVNGRIFVTTMDFTSNKGGLYAATMGSDLQFELIKTPLNSSSGMPLSALRNDNLYISFPDKEFYKLNVVTMEFESIALPQSLRYFSVAENGVISLMAQALFGELYVSDEFGENWKEYNYPKLGTTYFTSYENGIAMTGSGFKRYDSKSNQWIVEAKVQENCTYFLEDENMMPRFCVDIHGLIYRMDGVAWIKEKFQ